MPGFGRVGEGLKGQNPFMLPSIITFGGGQMLYKESQPTLMDFLGMLPVMKATQKQRFGGFYMRLCNFLEVRSLQYECGAILGRARRDKLDILEKMLLIPGTKGKLMKLCVVLQGLARERLNGFRGDIGKEPETFQEFILVRAFEDEGLSLTDWSGDEKETKKMIKACDDKVPLEKAEPEIKMYGLEGIGFGSSFPESTEKMYRNSCENAGMDVWSEARAHGLDVPEQRKILSLEEQEEMLLQMVASYTSEYYPDLLDPLDLRSYLKVERGYQGMQ